MKRRKYKGKWYEKTTVPSPLASSWEYYFDLTYGKGAYQIHKGPRLYMLHVFGMTPVKKKTKKV